MKQEGIDSYLKLSFPLLQFKDGANILYDNTNKDYIQVSDDNASIFPSQGEDFVFKFKINDPLLSCKLSYKRSYLCGLTKTSLVKFIF